MFQIRSRVAIVLLLLCFLGVAGTAQKTSPRFKTVSPGHSGLSYLNQITESDSLHVFLYEYLYNGAGIGIGDFNGDGKEDVFFSGNTASNRLFLNKGDLTFQDITLPAGVAGNGKWSTGVSVADVNGDGRLDLYVCHSGKYSNPDDLKNELFINLGNQDGIPRFADRAQAYGLDAPGTQSTQAAFFDYDCDGDLDMFLLNHSNNSYNPFLNTRKQRATPSESFGNRLFRNTGFKNGEPHFEDVTLDAGIINNALNFGLSVVVSDINLDGWPDILTTSDYTEKDCLYLNLKNGKFAENLEASLAHISKYSMGSDIADINNDGLPDILTLDMLPEDNHRQKMLKGPDEYDQYHLLLDSGYYKQQMRNMLHLHQGIDQFGHPRFSEIGQLAGISNTDWSWSPLFFDIDMDGKKDLFVTNGYLRDYTDLDFMKYTVADAKFQAAKEGHQNFQTHALVEKMPSNKIRNYIYHNISGIRFEDVSMSWGIDAPSISNAAAYADLDNDGDLDLIICNNNEPAQLLENLQDKIHKVPYLAVELRGNGNNKFAVGAKIELIGKDGLLQMAEHQPVRGYQSSQTYVQSFAIPDTGKVVMLRVVWPDGSNTEYRTLHYNTRVVITEPQIAGNNVVARLEAPRPFPDVTATCGLGFTHVENDFVDFKDEPLLPLMLSRMGPALATADVNGDNLDDIFLGGAIGQSGQLYIQDQNGHFVNESGPWSADAASEDIDAVFFDANGDGYPDLYVVSGGNEYDEGSPEYADRLYINDGKGNFSKLTSGLPAILTSKKVVSVADFDRDGDPDIFLGGLYKPGSYPMPESSCLLRNDSRNGVIQFTEISNLLPAAKINGAVTGAAWTDIDNDQWPDLVIVGDWMQPLILHNQNGTFSVIPSPEGDQNKGWWRSVTAIDLNSDGLTDFILGNAGTNLMVKAGPSTPMELVAPDIDQNGRLDPLLSYYIQGKSYPLASRDELLEQVVPLRKKFVYYKDYADLTISDFVPAPKLKSALHLQATTLESKILWNHGNLRFSYETLPDPFQFSALQAVAPVGVDKEGKKQWMVAGNFEPYRVQLGPSDASMGLLLKRERGDQYRFFTPAQTGIYLNGDIRKMIVAKGREGQSFLITATNNGQVQVLKIVN